MTRWPQSHSVGSPTPFGAVFYPFDPGSERGAKCDLQFRLLFQGPVAEGGSIRARKHGSRPAALCGGYFRDVSGIAGRGETRHPAFVCLSLNPTAPNIVSPTRFHQSTASNQLALKRNFLLRKLSAAPFVPATFSVRDPTKVSQTALASRLEIDCIFC